MFILPRLDAIQMHTIINPCDSDKSCYAFFFDRTMSNLIIRNDYMFMIMTAIKKRVMASLYSGDNIVNPFRIPKCI